MADRGTPAKLWQSLSKILRRDKELDNSSASPPALSADQFIQFFCHKVEMIRKDTENCPPPSPAPPRSTIPALMELKACTEDVVRRMILSSPTKSCTLDPIPTFLLKESVDVLLPYLTAMINASLREGRLPASQKHAILTPLLKKSHLDASDLKNYRPVSNLAFISKVAERIVVEKLVSHLQEQDLLPRLQSAYRRHHSTETALLRVMSDIYAAVDRQDVTLLGLLDLSAAFDCVDHDILVRRLQQSFSICGTALAWLQSFLHSRTQQVCFNRQLSTVVELLFGVPQGSVPVSYTHLTLPTNREV